MHGGIELDSISGQGTRASFWIPFKKAHYQDESSRLVGIDSMPERLQSDISVSCGSSENFDTSTLIPIAPNNGKLPLRHLPGNGNFNYAAPDNPSILPFWERKTVKILIVEDK